MQRLRVCNWFVTVDFRELALVCIDALVGRLRLGRSGRHSVDAAVGNVGGTHCARAAVESLRGRVGCGLVVCVGKQGLNGDHGGNPDGGRLVVTVRVLHARCAAALALFLENLQLQTSYKPIRMEIPHTSTVTNLNGTMPPDKKNILIISFSWIVDAGLGL